jgi:DNA polymerase III subunit delta'
VTAVLERVPGQPDAMAFLEAAAGTPRHAYVFAGPEGSGKALAARAFTAALLCADGGCGECRDCRLALEDRHPNVVLVEPEGRDIRVGDGPDDGGTARWMAARAYLTPPERGRKVFRVDQADRMTEEAADVLLKVLEEPPPDTVFVLSSARPHEIPETVRSRCQNVSFHPLPEAFVVETLTREGVEEPRARLASRLAGGNLGRARRIGADPEGLRFREAALEALGDLSSGRAGALNAAELLAAAAADYRKRLADRLTEELDPFLDPQTGAPLEQYRAAVRRLQERHQRQQRRAEREFLDWSLLALEAWFRDALLTGTGGEQAWAINFDRTADLPAVDAGRAALAVEVLEQARAALADETNLNARLVLEEAFLGLVAAGAAA